MKKLVDFCKLPSRSILTQGAEQAHQKEDGQGHSGHSHMGIFLAGERRRLHFRIPLSITDVEVPDS